MTRKEQLARGAAWFASRGWEPFPFQTQTWRAYLQGKNGIVNAATGSGKTYSLLVPIMLEALSKKRPPGREDGLQAIWISPIKALTKEIKASAEKAAEGLGLDWQISIRSGDTATSERSKQRKRPPQILITTPESLHLLLASNGYEELFANLKVIVADEWHELVGSKRGVQVELALSRLKAILPKLSVWGISATIGNMEEAAQVLFGLGESQQKSVLIRSRRKKKLAIKTIFPKNINQFAWAGHSGLSLAELALVIVEQSKTTLIFTNTRNQCERWYQTILELRPDLIGWVAMHHSAIDRKQREWVEDALHEGQLKLVVCTSSLDLGVDFRPVETIIQVGSPKGVARFLQRAGRSGHQPGATSVIHFLPAHAMELLEAAALRKAATSGQVEHRKPYIRSFDVLIQYLVTLSVSGGFVASTIFAEIKQTHCYASITEDEWRWCLEFITTGGRSLDVYDEYNRVGEYKGKYHIMNKGLAMRHRLGIGTIVSDGTLDVKYRNGSKIGSIEERFVAGLNKGDVFIFAGKTLEVVNLRDMEVRVKPSKSKKAVVPAWTGGRIQLSSQLSHELRQQLTLLQEGQLNCPELRELQPLVHIQALRSRVPKASELLLEYFHDRDGYHLVIYPFEGRFVHEGMSTLLAWRIAQQQPISFTIAVNDYGFELLSDQQLTVETIDWHTLLSSAQLSDHLQQSVNSVEMAKRQFRDIATIAGLVFKGFPGRYKRDKHLQSSSQLFFEVFQQYDPDNLLLLQAYEEVMAFQLEEDRLQQALNRIAQQQIVIEQPNRITPFAFPITYDRLREKLSSEKLLDRIEKMKLKIIA